jgi:hypothetical protein
MPECWRCRARCVAQNRRTTKDVGIVVIEAGVVAGYVVVWAVRKARRVAGRLNAEVDTVIDAGLDKLHDVVVIWEPTRP